MKKNNNTIRLTEQEFNTLIENSVKKVISEGKYGKLGNWLAAGALGGSLAAGGVGTVLQEPEHIHNANKTEITFPGTPEDEQVTQWMVSHNIEDTPENRQEVWEKMCESKSKRINIDKIIREEISKVL